MSIERTKDPRRVAGGRAGARKRWGEPRIVRLDELTAEQRRLVLALITAAKSAAVAEGQSPATAMSDGSGHDRPTA